MDKDVRFYLIAIGLFMFVGTVLSIIEIRWASVLMLGIAVIYYLIYINKIIGEEEDKHEN